MVKMKYYNGCSLVDFFSFFITDRSKETYGSENIDPRTERRLLDGGPAHPSDQKNLVIEGAFSKTEST